MITFAQRANHLLTWHASILFLIVLSHGDTEYVTVKFLFMGKEEAYLFVFFN